jgi:hypothetical protein
MTIEEWLPILYTINAIMIAGMLWWQWPQFMIIYAQIKQRIITKIKEKLPRDRVIVHTHTIEYVPTNYSQVPPHRPREKEAVALAYGSDGSIYEVPYGLVDRDYREKLKHTIIKHRN